MTKQTEDNPEQPEQIDREAAANIWRDYCAKTGEIIVERNMRAGGLDESLPAILTAHRRLGIEQGKRMAGGDMEYAAEMLANFARDRFANTKELTWATMGEHSQQYFRDAVEVVRAALTEQQEEG